MISRGEAAGDEACGAEPLPLSERRRSRERIALALAVLFMALYYTAIVTRLHVFGPVAKGMTFNSMLDHMLRGEFDVDPRAIGSEALVRDGRSYAYFGILPAFFRVLLIPFGKLLVVDVTRLSCAAAATLCSTFYLLTLARIERTGFRARDRLFWAFAATIVLGASAVDFLVATIFQEPEAWGAAFSAIFVFCAVEGLIVRRVFSRFLLLGMAALAGLALLTKVTYGIGLYVADALLLATLALSERRRANPSPARYLAPVALLCLFAAICGAVNYARWGNPAVFAPQRLYAFDALEPHRLAVFEQYGDFNLTRLPYGVLYYFFPAWSFVSAQGRFLFQSFGETFFQGVELPPSSFLISDPFLIMLAGLGLSSLALSKRRGDALFQSRQAAAVLSGLAVPGLILMTAIYLAFRYRQEFYPLLLFLAFLGFRAAHGAERGRRMRFFVRTLAPTAAVFGIIAAHLLLFAYAISPLGPVWSKGPTIARSGWIGFYEQQFRLEVPKLAGGAPDDK